MTWQAKETLRQLFCVIAIAALLIFALQVVFPYGPPSEGYDEQTTNPYYLAMPWYENVWRCCLAALLVGAASAVGFTMGALSQEKVQTRHLHEQLRQRQQ